MDQQDTSDSLKTEYTRHLYAEEYGERQEGFDCDIFSNGKEVFMLSNVVQYGKLC
jgi:hypothetical protein